MIRALLLSCIVHAAVAVLLWREFAPALTGIPFGRPSVELWTEGFGKVAGAKRVEPKEKTGFQTSSEPTAAEGASEGAPGETAAVELTDLMSETNRRPAYPPEALERGWTGNVPLLVRHVNGRVEEVTVLHRSSHECFETSARQAVMEWEIPRHLPEKITFTIRFSLDKKN